MTSRKVIMSPVRFDILTVSWPRRSVTICEIIIVSRSGLIPSADTTAFMRGTCP
jgi:hypothetical protein